MLSNLHLILTKIESTYNVDPVPVPANDAILVSGLSVTPAITKNERAPLSGSLSPFLSAKPTIDIVDVKFSVELKGSGTATVPPEVGPLLRAGGLSQVIGADVTYQPVSTGYESITIYAYLDGQLHKVTGCFGVNVELILNAGKPGVWNFTFQGIYQTPTDVAIPAGAVYDTTIPPTVESIGLTIDGYNPVSSKLQIALNNTISKRSSVNASGGIAGVRITGRKPAGSIDPEAVARSTYDYWQKMQDAAAVALSATVGSAAGNRLVITAPKVQYDSLAWGDREGSRIFEIPLSFGRNSGDDELVFKFN